MPELFSIIPSTQQNNDFIDNKIVEYNNQQVPFTQSEPFVNLNYVLKDDNGLIVGGITAASYCWNILYISMLWVDASYRNHGYGSQLLNKIEQEAKKMGCTLAHLDTFDFQAKNFYLNHG